MFRRQIIYADYAAGAPIRKEVKKIMAEWNDASFNPSAMHQRGIIARTAVEHTRKRIAQLLSAHETEIYFSGSATEAIHMGILGTIIRARRSGVLRPHVLVNPIEHPAVLELLRYRKEQGEILLEELPILPGGEVSLKEMKLLLRKETVLVILQYANNEIGTIEPIHEVAKIVRDYKKNQHSSSEHTPSEWPYIFVDACQAFPYLDCHIPRLGVDFLVLNSAKIGGPQGVGMLYGRRGTKFDPLFSGGGQERGFRPGTENVAGIIGFGEAMVQTQEDREQISGAVEILRDELYHNVKTFFPEVHWNGSLDNRLPNTLNLTFPGVDHQYLSLLLDAKGICVGTKSACRENDEGNSHVLEALRHAAESPLIPQGIRITLGWNTTRKEVRSILEALKNAVPLAKKSRTRTFSPQGSTDDL